MTDHHVHIGQFNKVYYDSHQVFDAIMHSGTGVNHVLYSSTSSCRYDVELLKVEEEIAYAQSFECSRLKLNPYLWFVPSYAQKGISVNSAMQSFDYAGIKLHPYAQKWDMQNPVHKNCMEQIFSYSSEYSKYILIHCGIEECVLPSRFEIFFKEFPDSKVILAHSNPAKDVLQLIEKYPNICCDTAYIYHTNYNFIKNALQNNPMLKDRILFGTDFPVTHYFFEQVTGNSVLLAEQYRKDYNNCLIL